MKIRFITFITILMILTFALPLSAQKRVSRSLPTFAEDTAMFPHDFNDDFYAANGIFAPAIIGRRTGTDFLSVFSMSSNPAHNNVRVLVALPAYDENGDVRFWTPLGNVNEKGFTDDELGGQAREIANLYPVFVFPKAADPQLLSFTNTRQAALFDLSQDNLFYKNNPLGLRTVFLVNYTPKAFTTKEGYLMMQFMEKKNGLSLEGTPLIKTKADIEELARDEFISIEKRALWDEPTITGEYSICPIIRTDKNELIAQDAFLIMATRDGVPMPGEAIFLDTFNYLKKFSFPPYDPVK